MEASEASPARIWTRPFVGLMLVTTLAGTAITTQMGTLALYVKSQGGSDAMSGLIVGVLGVAALALRLPVGMLLDRYGRKGILMLGLAVLVVDFGLLSVWSTLVVLLALRVVQGVGNCCQSTADAAMAADLIPPGRLEQGLGYFGLAQALPQAIGPLIGLALVAHCGYPALFVAGFGLVAAALVVSLWLPEGYRGRPRHRQVDQKPARVRLATATVVVPSLIVSAVGLANSGVISFVAVYAQERHVAGAGYYFLIVALSTIGVRLGFGRLLAVVPRRVVLLASTLMVAGAYGLLTVVTATWQLWLAAGLYGIGFGCLLPMMNAVVLAHVPVNQRGQVTAIFSGALDASYGGGVMIFGLIATLSNHMVMFGAITACSLIATVLAIEFRTRLA